VAENAKGEDADAATAALLSAEAHYHNDTVIAAAVGHGGPFPGFGIPHGGGGGWKRWHSSGRTHHATVAGGVSGRGAQGATAGCLGGDEAAGWGTRAALKEKFDVCAAQFPEGHGELTKAAFKALVDEMMRENDSDGIYYDMYSAPLTHYHTVCLFYLMIEAIPTIKAIKANFSLPNCFKCVLWLSFVVFLHRPQCRPPTKIWMSRLL
jgi:hypothetical protein